MKQILEVSRMEILISIAVCTLLSVCFGFGQASAAEGNVSTYRIDVVTDAVAEANDYMQTVIYVAAVCVFSVCLVIIMLAGKDQKRKKITHKDVTGQIRDVYVDNKS